ncbi:long-chain-fatty-acid--CoA ligase 1 [Hanseniaspora vineae]
MVQLVNIPVGKPANENETAPRVNYHIYNKHNGEIIDRPAGFKSSTVYEFAVEAFNRSKNKNVIGWRELIDIHEETKKLKKIVNGEEVEVPKTWQYFEMGDYQYQTGDEVMKIINNYGKGLVQMGLKQGGEEKMHIFAATSHKWMKTFLGAQTQAIPVATAYDTLGESGLIHSLVQTESKCVFTDNNLLCRLVNPVQKVESLKYIIHGDKLDPNDKRLNGKLYSDAKKAIDEIAKLRPDIKIYSMDEVVAMGQQNYETIEFCPPKPQDVSCIMYTSGSTGTPKGVVLTHANIVAGVGGVVDVVGQSIITPEDRVICFLPLAHIFELAFELIGFYWGACIGYATVKTLSDTSVRNCVGDMKTFQPTVMVGVAAVWEQVRKGIMAQINTLPSLTQKVFWAAYHTKVKCDKYHIPIVGSVLSNVIFKKVKQATGGHIRYMLNGGSPLSRDAQTFISTLIAPMLIGYGLTETVANTCVLDPYRFEFEVAGRLTGAVKVKLVSAEELGYHAKDNQGEVWIQGPSVLKEYYKNDEETKAAIVEDSQGRWFKTGDIGEWTSTGQLKIIDRMKNLVKTQNGEYIALEKLESVYRSNAFVDNICVYADQNKVKPIGIIVPNEKKLIEKAKQLNLIQNDDDVSSVLENKKLRSEILNELLKTGKSQGLAGIELLLGIVLFDGEWTPQNGFVTSAQKLQRKKILKAVENEVNDVYAGK